MRKYYCDKCGKEMSSHHIVEINFTGKMTEKEYEKELCNECFYGLLNNYNMKE
jgi:hypothetical protein